jgi:Fic family protein
LASELELGNRSTADDVGEIVNYVRAMNYGLARIETLPLSLRLIRELHAELLRDGRGSQSAPGNFRTTQNWIGPAGAAIEHAGFVPPPVPEMTAALTNLEWFLHNAQDTPVLIRAALAHAQFESIHPFLDGNGRVGRLLVTFMLIHEGVLAKPLLYLSLYLKRHRIEYYDRLMAIRQRGDWEAWLRFFLRGVADTASEATATAQRIYELRERHRAIVVKSVGSNGLRLLSSLFQLPVTTARQVSSSLGISYQTANRLLAAFEDLQLLVEVTGQRRGRLFRYDPYLDLFAETDARSAGAAPNNFTQAVP